MSAGVIRCNIERPRIQVAGQIFDQTTNLRRRAEKDLRHSQNGKLLSKDGHHMRTLVSGRVEGTCNCFFRDKNDALLPFEPFLPCSLNNTFTPSAEYSDAKLRRLS